MRMTTRKCLLLLFAIPCLVKSLVAAQSVGYGNTGPGSWGTGEIYGYGGVRDGGHGTVGAAAGLLFAKYGGYFLDMGYSSLGSSSVRTLGQPLRQSRLYDFALLGHVRIPVKPKFEPYLIVGGGAFYNTFQIANPPANPAVNPLQLTYVGASTTNFAFHTGVGLRYFIHSDWGIRPEIKVSISGQTYVGFTIGFFYQIPNDY